MYGDGEKRSWSWVKTLYSQNHQCVLFSRSRNHRKYVPFTFTSTRYVNYKGSMEELVPFSLILNCLRWGMPLSREAINLRGDTCHLLLLSFYSSKSRSFWWLSTQCYPWFSSVAVSSKVLHLLRLSLTQRKHCMILGGNCGSPFFHGASRGTQSSLLYCPPESRKKSATQI